MYRGAPGPPITSYNNAVEFTGCATTDVPSCRQMPEDEPGCLGEHFRTADDLAVFAACFAVRGRDGGAVPHDMRFNAYNRPRRSTESTRSESMHRQHSVAKIGTGLLELSRPACSSIRPGHPVEMSGCALRYLDGNLACDASPSVVGAMLPDESRFDLDLPFRFPFIDVFRGDAPAHK